MVRPAANAARVSPVVVRIGGLVASLAYAAAFVWVYLHQPQTLAEVRGGFASSIGAYRADPVAFDEGLQFFRRDQFIEARLAWDRADPAHRDPVTQFYVAYSFYRQGWGRVYTDTALFREGLAAIDRSTAAAPDGRVVVQDPGLQMHSSDEVKAELERGLTHDVSDLNPLKVLRVRK